MGTFCDYFAAPSDDVAIGVLDLEDWPATSYDTVDLKGIEPVVNMQTLEGLLTGRSEEEVANNPRQGEILELDPDSRAIVAITTELQTALATASVATLSAAARPWAETEELAGSDQADLTGVLIALAGLARRASSRGDNLYCLVTL